MYNPGHNFIGGAALEGLEERRWGGIIQDRVRLLIHWNMRQHMQANPANRPNPFVPCATQNSFEEWWEDEDEEPQQPWNEKERDAEGENESNKNDASEADLDSSKYLNQPSAGVRADIAGTSRMRTRSNPRGNGGVSGLLDSRKRPASCHYSPFPSNGALLQDYKRRHTTHATCLPRDPLAPVTATPLTSPQITALRMDMYHLNRFHSRNVFIGLAIAFGDTEEYDKATMALAGLETRPQHFSAIKGISSRWFDMYWGTYEEEYLYMMERFGNEDTNPPLNIIKSFSARELDQQTISGMPQEGPQLYDEFVNRVQWPTVKDNTYKHKLSKVWEKEPDVHGTMRHLPLARRNINYTAFARTILQTLFHACVNRRDWDTAARIYGALVHAKHSNGLFLMPQGLEVLRNSNYRRFVNSLTRVTPVGDTHETTHSSEVEVLFKEQMVHVDANTLHVLAELRNPILLPLLLANDESPAFEPAMAEIEDVIRNPHARALRAEKYIRHFARAERTTDVVVSNGPESTLYMPSASRAPMPPAELTLEEEAEFEMLNSPDVTYKATLPHTKFYHRVLRMDVVSNYRLGNKAKYSPAMIAYVELLLMQGKFEAARDAAEAGSKKKAPTAEGGLLVIQALIGQILAKLSQVMTVSDGDDTRREALMKEVESLHNESMDLWAKWKDEYGFVEGEGENEDFNDDAEEHLSEPAIIKRRRLDGMDNWHAFEENIIRLGVWVEFVKHGGKVGMGVDVFGQNLDDNVEEVLDENESELEREMARLMGIENESVRNASDEDGFDSDNSDYQREMSKYASYGTQSPAPDATLTQELDHVPYVDLSESE